MQIDLPLLKVLLVDDEPYIRMGLAALIDWEAEGFCISGEASNGLNAIEMLKENEYDLIITDIKMPEMDGIDFINQVKKNELSNARFIILSGFYDFQYAKTAIQCGCRDYILKPVQKEELLETIRDILIEYQNEAGTEMKNKDYEKAFLDKHLTAVIWGKFDSININYIQEKIVFQGEMAYVHCEISLNDDKFITMSEDLKRETQRRLYGYATLLLKNQSDHVIFDVMKHNECYDIGIIYSSLMSEEKQITADEWMNWLIKELSERVGCEIEGCMGSTVQGIHMISDSFRETVMLRSFRFFKKNGNARLTGNDSLWKLKKEDYLKKEHDDLIHVIEINDKAKIRESACKLYRNMMEKNVEPDAVVRNVQYLLHRLLGLAYDQEADINQEEIMQYIRKAVFSTDSNHGNELKFQQFAEKYADYLTQLKQNKGNGTIHQVEAEIEDNYAENLSLKTLGEKYFINSAYLGQVFKKQYGYSFKDYLNNVRIRKAAELILNTDKMIYEIATDVGYKNQEYFINKFEEVYGMTPTRFRKKNKF